MSVHLSQELWVLGQRTLPSAQQALSGCLWEAVSVAVHLWGRLGRSPVGAADTWLGRTRTGVGADL